uniref:Uncharacterized protein n=1 Tax=viral metagenome TaxID=1070528 RepID=A0A6M3LHN6_9ZZZZ
MLEQITTTIDNLGALSIVDDDDMLIVCNSATHANRVKGLLFRRYGLRHKSIGGSNTLIYDGMRGR